jgi:hypothetical protein
MAEAPQSRLPFMIREALATKYRAEVATNLALLSILFERPVSTAWEDTNHVDQVDVYLTNIMMAQDKLSALDRVVPLGTQTEPEGDEDKDS